MKTLKELESLCEAAERLKPNGQPNGDANYEFQGIFTPELVLRLISAIKKADEALTLFNGSSRLCYADDKESAQNINRALELQNEVQKLIDGLESK